MSEVSNRLTRRLSTCLMLVLSLALVLSPISLTKAEAAGTSVRNGPLTFTIDSAVLSAETNATTLQFQLKAVNSGKSAVRLSDYGVRVVRTGSGSISAKLLTKLNARLDAGKSAASRYAATVPAGSKLTDYKIVVFKWNSGGNRYMTDLGQVSAAQAAAAQTASAVVALSQADSAYASSLSVQWKSARTYRVVQDGLVYLYADLWLTNKSASQVTLPTALAYRLKAAPGADEAYAAEILAGLDKALQPNETRKVTLRAAVPAATASAKGWVLQLYAAAQNVPMILGTVSVGDTEAVAAIGGSQSYLAAAPTSPLAYSVTRTTLTSRTDGILYVSTVTLRNTGSASAAVTEVSAVYQYQGLGATEAKIDTGSHPTYLAAGASASYTFSAVLPSDVEAADVRLILRESKAVKAAATGTGADNSAGLTLPVSITGLAAAAPPADAYAAAAPYKPGAALKLQQGTLSSDLSVSLLELKEYRNPDTGYRTAVGKFKLTNNGTAELALPAIGNELIGEKGGAYPGTRQSTSVQTILPGTSFITAYSYVLPDSETASAFALNVYDSVSAAGDKVSLGSFRVQVENDSADTSYPYAMNLYPYQLKVLDPYYLTWNYDTGASSYTGQVKIDVSSMRTDNVNVESGFTGVQFDLVNRTSGKTLGSVSYGFAGTNKLKDGQVTLKYSGVDGDQIGLNAVRIYETIPTPNGTVRRLLMEIPAS
ncbi:hypothetical protein [Gorillibacterium sp. sgz500922]|uniref:hypothetical protein n=1 Tax=Gorillibacterium sp. sgz500922 TaxID=3446694 RepID=UPI003F6611B1